MIIIKGELSKGMFFGEYDHQVDAKNRIRIPSKFKSELSNGYYFVKGTTKCISIYPTANMEQFVNQFSGVNILDTEGQEALTEIFGNVFPGDEDGQGRVVLPKALREYAGIEKDVVAVGMVNRIDIYAKEERERIRNEKSYNERLSALRGSIK